jgi:nucleotide-binding universal stress UspA family protein
VARELATRHEAAVTAMYAVMPSFIEVPFALDAAGPALQALKDLDDERRRRAFTLVEPLRKGKGPRVEWAEAAGNAPVHDIVRQACYADLLVLGQREPQPHSSGVPNDFVESVVIGSGRPALVLPHAGVPTMVGGTVLVAWKESAQAVHALAGAMPMLRRAQRVHVAAWGGAGEAASGPLDIGGYLGAHGVKAEVHRFDDQPESLGELLLSMAADFSVDLLVMGCYGHSRARELVLGGATRTVLASMTVPVLMAH